MNPLNYKLNDNFALEGIWSSDYDDKKVHGTLIHRSNNTTELKLFDNLKLSDYPSNEFSIIGEIRSGYNIFCVKAYIVSVEPINYISKNCPINHFVILRKDKISNEEISTFDSFSFSFLHLREWLPCIDHAYVNNSDEKGIIFKNYGPEYVGDIRYGNKEYKLYIKKSIIPLEEHEKTGWAKEYFNKISYEIDSEFEIKAKEISVEEAIGLCRNICGLFEILLDDYSKILYLGNSECNVFPIYVYSNMDVDEHQLNFSAINYDNIDLINIINNWLNKFNKDIDFHRLAANFLSDVNNPSTIENSLLNITQGIEMYYAHSRYRYLLSKLIKLFINLPEKYAIKISKITDNIITISAKRVIAQLLKKDREAYTLNESGKLLKSLDDSDFKKALILLSFLAELKDTRVFLTHGNDERKDIFKNKDLKDAVAILNEVVRMVILLKLGIPEDELNLSLATLNNIEKLSINYNYDKFN